MPAGAQIQDGKYYKIKVASYLDGSSSQPWIEHTGYIRVYKDNLLLQNKTITHDQFGNSVTLENSTVPIYANVKIVAKTQIKISPSSRLTAGRYYIDNFDCTNLSQFKSLRTNNNLSNNNVTDLPTSGNSYTQSKMSTIILDQSKQKSSIEKTKNINIYPNPTDNYFMIESELTLKRIDVYNNLGVSVIEKTNIESVISQIDLSSQPVGIYFLKITNADGSIFTEKIIKQ